MAVLVPTRKERGELSRFRSELDNLFRDFFEEWEMPLAERRFWPAVDISETDDYVIVKADIPGCKSEDIDISVQGNILTISGEKKKEKKEKGFYHIERSYGSFQRNLYLPCEVEANKIEAVCKEGILTVTMPKSEKSKAIQIKVKGQ